MTREQEERVRMMNREGDRLQIQETFSTCGEDPGESMSSLPAASQTKAIKYTSNNKSRFTPLFPIGFET